MPMNLNKYPKNWKSIAHTIKHEAKWECQECKRPCRKPGVSWPDFVYWICTERRQWCEETCDGDREKMGRFVLTVAHLNHNTRDNRKENLKALCPKCHLKHDMEEHIRNAKLTRRRKKIAYYKEIGQQLLPLDT